MNGQVEIFSKISRFNESKRGTDRSKGILKSDQSIFRDPGHNNEVQNLMMHDIDHYVMNHIIL